MNDWQSIIGHKEHIGYLQTVLERDTVPQCMVFAGPERVGKRTTADAFVKALIERFPASEVRHLDAWDSEKREYKTIKVDDIRACIAGSLYSRQFDAWHVTVIDGADYLSDGAVSALLKVTEEPGARVLFILITHRLASVLPTIRSRACVLRFRLVPSDVLSAGIRSRGMDVDEKILRRACGLPGLILGTGDILSSFDIKCFTAPPYKQIAISSALTGDDMLAVESALEQLAHTSDALSKQLLLTYGKHYVNVHSASRMGSMAGAYEYLFF